MNPPRRPPPTAALGVSFRPAEPDADAERIAELMSEYGFRGWTEDGMRRHFADAYLRPRRTIIAVRGAGSEGAPTAGATDVVGYADVYRNDNMAPGSFLLSLIIDPLARRRGAGGRLYDEALGFAAAHRLRELRTPAWDDDAESLAFAARRGFETDYLVVSSRLDATTFNESHFAPVVDRVRARGIRLFSLEEVPDTPENRRRLYEIYRETWLDAPDGPPHVDRMPPPDEFAAPLFRPDAARGLLLAAEGGDGEWIGFTHLLYYSKDWARHAMTGVRRVHRGRGVALALMRFDEQDR